MAPCLLGYGAIASQLHADPRSKKEGNLYWTWIQNYVAEDYVSAIKTGSGEWSKDAVNPDGGTADADSGIQRAAGETRGAPEPGADRGVGQGLYSRNKGRLPNRVVCAFFSSGRCSRMLTRRMQMEFGFWEMYSSE